MRGGTLRAVKDFDGVLRGADLDILLRERVRNYQPFLFRFHEPHACRRG